MRIAVFCGSSRGASPGHLDAARALGSAIARRGHTLVYGGGRTGLMGALADAALAAGGRVEGVILADFVAEDSHHRGLHELVSVGDMRTRKAGLDARADAFVALPGGLGTLEELTEILCFRKLGLHRRPVAVLDVGGYFGPLLEQLGRAVAEGFDDPAVRDALIAGADPLEVLTRIEAACQSAVGS